ncbi:MAG: hypothetical protein ABI668_05180 [Sphingorhabdus sp.]
MEGVRGSRIAYLFILLALAIRVAVPSGWMPSGERGFALTVCAGMDTATVWIDAQGKIHKEDPSKGKSIEHAPCAFAGATAAVDHPPADFAVTKLADRFEVPIFASSAVAVGTGLAAPPPPAIGPPNLI